MSSSGMSTQEHIHEGKVEV